MPSKLHSDHLHCETLHISKGNAVQGRCCLQLGFCFVPEWHRRQKERNPCMALPELTSAAVDPCLSPPNILSPFSQAWKDGKSDRAVETRRMRQELWREHRQKTERGRNREGKSGEIVMDGRGTNYGRLD